MNLFIIYKFFIYVIKPQSKTTYLYVKILFNMVGKLNFTEKNNLITFSQYSAVN